MSDDQFTKLFKYIQGFRKEMQAELATKADKKQVEAIHKLLDDHLKHREIEEHERAAMNSQLDRHDKWINQLAKNTGTRLAS